MSHNESAMSSVSRRKAYRAAIVHSLADPAEVALEASYEYFADGLLLVEDGKIVSVGHAADLLERLDDDVELIEYPDALITPGFIDTHIHLPQTGMIGSYGEQLLDWLNTYTFPCESQFAEPRAFGAGGRHLHQGIAAQRYDHGAGVRQCAQGIGRGIFQCGPGT